MTQSESAGRTFWSFARRFFRFLVRPLYRLLLRFVVVENPWQRFDSVPIGHGALGAGSLHSFEWYFEGESNVHVSSIDDVCTWLRSCRYEDDLTRFGVADYWQHPSDFENTQCGDCDDHALWAWRKLIELGVAAEFYSGLWMVRLGYPGVHHAWVCFRDAEDRHYLFETTAKPPGRMIVPLEIASASYQPHFSVDATCRPRCHGGFVQYLRNEHLNASQFRKCT